MQSKDYQTFYQKVTSYIHSFCDFQTCPVQADVTFCKEWLSDFLPGFLSFDFQLESLALSDFGLGGFFPTRFFRERIFHAFHG